MVFEQQFDHGAISVLSSGVNRNPSALLTGVDGGSVLEEQAGGFEVANGGGGVQRHDLHGIRRDGVDCGSAFEEQTGGFGLAEKTGEVQSRESVLERESIEPELTEASRRHCRTRSRRPSEAASKISRPFFWLAISSARSRRPRSMACMSRLTPAASRAS